MGTLRFFPATTKRVHWKSNQKVMAIKLPYL
jgi:hypothetical protein